MAASEPEQRRQLAILAGALVLAMSTWFSTAAVLGQLREAWDLSQTAGAWLTIMVQIGFIGGAIVSSLTNLADQVPARRLILYGTIGAAVSNLLVVVGGGFAVALPARFLTGFFLAAVYPPSLKAMSSWYREGRGFALGVMIGALTLGSAMPHLLNALGGLDWTLTLTLASALTVAGGLIAEYAADDGPYATKAAGFNPGQLKAITRNPRFALASAGYFGHMWELYAMWAWIAAFYSDVFATRGGDNAERLASLAAFSVIGIGAVGSAYAGSLSDKTTRAGAAAVALRWSAALSLVVGFLVDAPLIIVLGAGLVWGFWVVADSAQFSTVVTEVTDPDYVGTALTVQLAAGFVLTVFTIFLVPVIRDGFGWGWAFLLLAPGPALGGWAMRKLRDLPVEAKPKPDPQPSFVSPFF